MDTDLQRHQIDVFSAVWEAIKSEAWGKEVNLCEWRLRRWVTAVAEEEVEGDVLQVEHDPDASPRLAAQHSLWTTPTGSKL